MAKESRSSKRRSVPVSSRKAAGAPRQKPRKQKARLGAFEIGILVSVALVVLLIIAVPLRNYFQQRSEIARLTESIAMKQAEKERLQSEIEDYRSEAYVREQARQRLGVIAQGETAYRIIDPRMDRDSSVTSDVEAENLERPWYEILWTSISEPEMVLEEEAEERLDTRMPIEPGTETLPENPPEAPVQ